MGTPSVVYVVVRRSRVTGLAALLGCALFVLASLAIIAQGSVLTLVVGTVGVLTLTGFGIGWIVLLLRAGPVWSWTTQDSKIGVLPLRWAA